jgi:septum site-determining protein MinC
MVESMPFPSKQEAFEFRSATRVDLLAFQPKTDHLEEIAAQLRQQLGNDQQHLFYEEALLIDLSQVSESTLDLAALVTLMRQYHLHPIAIRHGSPAQQHRASELKLGVLRAAQQIKQAAVSKQETAMIVSRPVRTGQQIYAKGQDLVILNVVSAGAEVIADGSIHVYAPLRGRALAGAQGDMNARIFTTCMNAELISIAGIYRALDENLPGSLHEQAIQVFLDNKKLVIEALSIIN